MDIRLQALIKGLLLVRDSVVITAIDSIWSIYVDPEIYDISTLGSLPTVTSTSNPDPFLLSDTNILGLLGTLPDPVKNPDWLIDTLVSINRFDWSQTKHNNYISRRLQKGIRLKVYKYKDSWIAGILYPNGSLKRLGNHSSSREALDAIEKIAVKHFLCSPVNPVYVVSQEGVSVSYQDLAIQAQSDKYVQWLEGERVELAKCPDNLYPEFHLLVDMAHHSGR